MGERVAIVDEEVAQVEGVGNWLGDGYGAVRWWVECEH